MLSDQSKSMRFVLSKKHPTASEISQSKTSLSSALILRSLPIALTIILLSSLMILYFSRQVLIADLDRKYEVLAQRVHEDSKKKLDSVLGQAEIMANNSLVMNSLIDVAQRENYMPVFFRSVKIAGVTHADVYLANFKGNEIVRNATDIGLHQITPEWKSSVLERGEDYFSLTDAGLLIAKPVKIGGAPEGAIVVWLNSESVNRLLNVNLYGIHWAWLSDSGVAYFSSNHDLVPPGNKLQLKRLEQWYWKEYRFSNMPNRILLAEANSSAFSTLNQLLIAILVLSTAALLAVTFGAFNTAKKAAFTLEKLTRNVQGVKRSGELASFKVPAGSTREMAELGVEISELLKDIDSSTLSRLYVESIVNSMNELLVTCDTQGNISTLNATANAALDSMNLTSRQLPISQFFNSQEALTGDMEELSFESTLVLNNGATKNISWQRSLLKSESGELTGYLFVGTDITAIRAIESQLILKEQAIEAAPTGIIICDARAEDMPIIYTNRSFLKISGYQLDEVVGHNCRFLQGEDTDLETVAQIRNAIHEETPFYGVILNYRKDGTPFYNELIISPVKDSNGVVTHYLGVTNDVTERVNTENELVLQKMKAEVASEAKSQFLANMSHEIRTPLNGVLGMANLLMGTPLTEEQRHQVSTLHDSGASLLSLINDILDFSKIEAGKMDIDLIQFSLPQLVESVVSILQVKAHEKQLQLLVEFEKSLPESWIGDPGRLRQVLMNLVGNALKFTSEGSVTVKVSSVKSNRVKGNLQFDVIDTGMGIPKDKVEHLFQEFEQLDTSRTRRFGGTGLGLAISKKLVELMGGDVWVSSEPDKGSAFSFSVSCEPDKDSFRPIPVHRLKMVNCLLLADESALRDMVITELDPLLKTLTTIETTAEVKEKLVTNPASISDYDLVIVVDPFYEQLQSELDLHSVNIKSSSSRWLLVTAAGNRDDTQKLRELGFKGYLAMPFTASQLRLLVQLLMVEGVPENNYWFITKHWVKEHQRQISESTESSNEKSSTETDSASSELTQLKELELNGKRLLLVEDNKVNQMVIGEYIKRTGAECEIANNGIEALEKVRQNRYDLVLMDMQMPEMDGIEATKILRKDYSDSELPIVALTANVLEEDRNLCKSIGMNDHLSKPIVIKEMIRVFQQFVKAA